MEIDKHGYFWYVYMPLMHACLPSSVSPGFVRVGIKSTCARALLCVKPPYCDSERVECPFTMVPDVE